MKNILKIFIQQVLCVVSIDSLLFLHRVKIGIGAIGIEWLVAVHHCYEVFRLAQVDDVVGVAREHYHALDFFAAHLKIQHFVGALFAHLYQAVSAHHDELLPLGVVPMLPLGNTGFADVDTHLSAFDCADKFGERAALIAVHFQVEYCFFFWQVTQKGAIETFCKRVCRDFWYCERRWQLGKAIQQIDNLAMPIFSQR